MSEKESFFKDVPSRINVDELERGVLDYWEQEKIFEASLEQNKGGELYSFYDGPPYATGKPHYGHILQSAIKDAVLRYKTMRGYYVPRRVGWDTHGLPIENIVEKELGFTSKRDIESFGIEKFNQKCRETVFRYIDEFTKTLQRMGRWADYEGAYSTLDRDYMESEWWVFKQLWDKNLVYTAFRSTPYCIRCGTPLSNFEVSMAYKDTTDEAVYVKLRVVDGGGSSTSLRVDPSTRSARSESNQELWLLIWTTTPWTLPANVAVAYNTEIEYIEVEFEGEHYVVSRDRVEALFGNAAKEIKPWGPSDLSSLVYEPLYPGVAQALEEEPPFTLVEGEHVTANEGTGFVHLAPAFGEEDFEIGKQVGLPTLRTVDRDGRFVPDVGSFSGENIFEANPKIIADLKERGHLFRRESYTHSYPFCWRCDEPLIYYAIDSWFVRVEKIRQRMLDLNEHVNWTPSHVKKGRFAKGIESAPDWAVSRSRYWSVPMPIWQCDSCEERVCIGSIKELADKSKAASVDDLHRPYVDAIDWPCSKCSGTMRRIPEVLDVWFDSGSMPYSQWHYPFENKEFVKQGFPADFIVESIEMTRAWFYTLHVLAAAVMEQRAFTNVIASGIIFGEDGNKLSKKLKNYPEIEPALKRYGADTMRMYFLASTLGEPYNFSEKGLNQMYRGLYITLWNVYSFFVRYANTHDWAPQRNVESRHVLDRWMLARLAELQRDVITHADNYRIDHAARSFARYVDDLSNWYLRRSRQRFQRPTGEQDTHEAYGTLHEVLVKTATFLAPFMPFVAEEMWRNLTGSAAGPSVHLEAIAEAPALSAEQEKVLEEMRRARDVVKEGLAVRAAKGIKVRQPLAEAIVIGESLSDEIADIVKDELNVKAIAFASELPAGEQYAASGDDSKMPLALNTELSDELRSEGIAREIIRHGQILRREAGYSLDDRIALALAAEDSGLQKALDGQLELIKDALQADSAVPELEREDKGADVMVAEGQVHIGVRKA